MGKWTVESGYNRERQRFEFVALSPDRKKFFLGTLSSEKSPEDIANLLAIFLNFNTKQGSENV